MLIDSNFESHRERRTVPTDVGINANDKPLSAPQIEALLNRHLTAKHRSMLESDCGIAPEVLARSKCFSLENDSVGKSFLSNNGFGGGKSLIDEGIVFPDFGWRGELLGNSILSQQSRLDEKGRNVYVEEADGITSRVGIYPGVRELAADIFSDLFVWTPNPAYALIAASKGMAAYHVVDGDYTGTAARSFLRQSLHAFDTAWGTCEKVNTHVFFLQTDAQHQRSFDSMRVIADVMRDRGAEVLEIQLSSFHFGEEWQPGLFGIKPTPQHIARAHHLLDWLSAHRYDHFSK